MKNIILLPFITLVLLLGSCGEVEDSAVEQEAQNTASVEENKQEESFEEETNDEESEKEDPESTSNSTATIQGELRAHYIDVGQADSTLIEYSHNGTDYRILIDAGDWNSNNVVNYLNEHNIKHIDILVGTHVHADHIGQMDKVINQFEIGEVWMTGNTATSKTYERVLDAIESSDAGYYEPRSGDVFDVGPLTIEIVHPSSLSGNFNNDSISMKITYGNTTFLFTGDAEKSGENAMLSRGHNLNAQILQLGHHGSSTSTTQRFLDEVNPKVAIYSAGIDNSYGHPHDEIVNRVLNAGIELYGTDQHGTIIVTTDGTNYSIQTKKDGTITPSSSGGTSTFLSNNNNNESTTSNESNMNSSCVNINTASLEELQRIKHIGTDRAQQIIDLRSFNSVDGLTGVKGIGAGRLDDIKAENLACVGG